MKMSLPQILKKFTKDIKKNFKKSAMNLKMSSLIKIRFYKILQIITEGLIPTVNSISHTEIYKKII